MKKGELLEQFINENIVKGTPDDKIKKTEIRNHFNEWYQTNYQQRPPKATELYEQLENIEKEIERGMVIELFIKHMIVKMKKNIQINLIINKLIFNS